MRTLDERQFAPCINAVMDIGSKAKHMLLLRLG